MILYSRLSNQLREQNKDILIRKENPKNNIEILKTPGGLGRLAPKLQPQYHVCHSGLKMER